MGLVAPAASVTKSESIKDWGYQMNRRQIGLKLVLNELGVPQDLGTFDNRLVLQKAVYLAQQADIPLGYHYSWYLRGPYSPALTSDAYANINCGTPDDWGIGDEIKAKIQKIKSFISSLLESENPPREFENLASVLFIIKTKQAAESETAAIVKKMLEAGKQIDESGVQSTIEKLKKNGFLPKI